MIDKTLIYGLKFAYDFRLTYRELEATIKLIEKEFTLLELSTLLNINPKTLSHVLHRLKLKKIILTKNKKNSKAYLYTFNINLF